MEYLFINSLYNNNNNKTEISSEIKQFNHIQQSTSTNTKFTEMGNTNTLSDKLDRLYNPIIKSTQERSKFYNLRRDKMGLLGFKQNTKINK